MIKPNIPTYAYLHDINPTTFQLPNSTYYTVQRAYFFEHSLKSRCELPTLSFDAKKRNRIVLKFQVDSVPGTMGLFLCLYNSMAMAFTCTLAHSIIQDQFQPRHCFRITALKSCLRLNRTTLFLVGELELALLLSKFIIRVYAFTRRRIFRVRIIRKVQQ